MDPLRHIGRRHIHLDVTDSTNTRAAELAFDPSYAGTVVTAGLQSRGRGQHGRVWESPPGVNVLLSALLFPPPDLRRPAVLTAFAAVAVCDTIQQIIGAPTRIKWPNDVLLDGKKVCGILIECGVAPDASVPHAVVGIGLNVNQSVEDFARAGLPDATSLAVVAGRSLDVTELTRRLVGNLDAGYARLADGDFAPLEAGWTGRVGLLGRPVAAELADSSEVRGRLTELTLRGLCLAHADATPRRLLPEEVRHLSAIDGGPAQ